MWPPGRWGLVWTSGRRLCCVGPQIEVVSAAGSWRLPLESDRMTVGKSPENDVATPDDPTASGLHAVLERFAAGWCVTDLGSSNGTWLNGARIWSAQRLRHGDEIRVGQTRLIFRDPVAAGGAITQAEDVPPPLTARESAGLIPLCPPPPGRALFTPPPPPR